jgi:hypothetical protein
LANLDIAVVVFALMVNLVMMIFALSVRQLKRLGLVMTSAFGVFTIGYFLANYSFVTVGSTTIPMTLIALTWIFVCILMPSVLLIKQR